MVLQETWYRSTAERGRRRLFPRGILALFGATMALVGMLALPSKSLHERLANADESSLLTVAYLHAWLNATPRDAQLRLTLARHQALLGQDVAALATLDALRESGPAELQASVARVRLNVLERLAWQLDDGPRRRALLAEVGTELGRVALQARDAIELDAYYRRALALGDAGLSATLLGRLSARVADPAFLASRPRPIEQYAREAVALGDFRLASLFYWRAFDEAPDNRRRLALLALVARTEQAGGRLDAFFADFEGRRARVVLDVDTYEQLARFALAANRLDLAERFAKEMLRFAGNDPAGRMPHALGWRLFAERVGRRIGVIAAAVAPIRDARAATVMARGADEGMPAGLFDAAPDPPGQPPGPVAAPRAQPPPASAQAPTRTAPSAATAMPAPATPAATAATNTTTASTPARAPAAAPESASAPERHPTPATRAQSAHEDQHHDVRVSPTVNLDRHFTVTGNPSPDASAATPASGARDFVPLTDSLRVGRLVDRIYETSITASARPPSPRPRLAFDPDAYALAYDVMLANANLEDAYAIAWVAVRHEPANTDWNLRLARVAEWSARPEVALDAWHALATRTGRDDAWREVERLARGLRDEPRLAASLRNRIRQRPDDVALVFELSDAYERQGEPHRAIDLLENRLAAARPASRLPLLERLADVAERAGDPPRMLDALRRTEAAFGPQAARAVRIATAEYRLGRVAVAFDALDRSATWAADPARHDADAEARIGFWSTYANLANQLQHTTKALAAYRQLARLDRLDRDALTTVAVVLARRAPEDAAEALAIGYRRFGDAALARQAITHWLQSQRFDEAEAFIASLDPALRRAIVSSPAFLRERAGAYQSAGRLAEAMADRLEVYRLAPQDMENRAATMWLALARRDVPRLRMMLARWRGAARTESRLWGPFGASLLALDEPGEALPYFVWQARENQDYLWWLAYADALGAAGRPDAAWQLRRRAWRELRKAPPRSVADSPAARERVVALAMQFEPSDQAAGLLRRLLQDRPIPPKTARAPQAGAPRYPGDAADVPPGGREVVAGKRQAPPVRVASISPAATPAPTVAAEALRRARVDGDPLEALIARAGRDLERAPLTPDPLRRPKSGEALRAERAVADELALSWLLATEENEAARGWLLSRYAQDLTRPAWARLSLALGDADLDEIDQLLETMPDWLPKLDRVQALSKAGRPAQAQTLAFDTAASRPDSDAAHETLVEQMTREQPTAGITSSLSTQDAYSRRTTRVDGATRLDQHALLRAWIERDEVRSRDERLLADPGGASRTVGLALEWTASSGRWLAELGRRTGLATSTPARVRWSGEAASRVAVTATAALAQVSTDSAMLAAGGQKDLVGFDARYLIGRRDYVAARVEVARLETRLDTALGTATNVGVEFGHRLRTEYPDLTLRAVLNRTNNPRNNTVDPIVTRLTPPGSEDPAGRFVGSSSTQFDLYATVGSTIVEGYTRAARPFLELGSHHNSVSGASASARGGIGLGVFGADRLTLYAAFTSATQSSPGGSREAGVSYRLSY